MKPSRGEKRLTWRPPTPDTGRRVPGIPPCPDREEDVVTIEVFGLPTAVLTHVWSTTTDVIGAHLVADAH